MSDSITITSFINRIKDYSMGTIMTDLENIRVSEKELKKLSVLLKCDIFEVAEKTAQLIEHTEELKQEKIVLQNKLMS